MGCWVSACLLDHTRIAPEKHFADKAVLVDRLDCLLLARRLWRLGPHFLYILQDHVKVAIKCFNPAKQLAVVAAVYQDLRARLYGLRQQTQWACVELLLLQGRKLFCRLHFSLHRLLSEEKFARTYIGSSRIFISMF